MLTGILTFLVTLGAIAAAAWFFYIKPKFFKKRNVIPKSRLDIFLVSGPSGCGKGTLIGKLMQEFPEVFGFCVSHTSRAPRAGEVNGKQYHFSTVEKMTKMAANGEFLENTSYAGNMYGTSKKALEAVTQSGKVAIIEIDVKGAQQLKKAIEGTKTSAVYVFLKAPSLEELKARIEKRGDAPEKIPARLAAAKDELEFVETNPDFYDRTLCNENVDDCYRRLKNLLKTFGALDAVSGKSA